MAPSAHRRAGPEGAPAELEHLRGDDAGTRREADTLSLHHTTSIYLPLTIQPGVDPVQFGIMLIVNPGVGLVTPALGPVLLVACAIGKVSIVQTVHTMWSFYLALLVSLAAVAYVPEVSMWLPERLARS